ncbi:MAG: DUF1499 domain-containing protein [Synechococcaceae cyanobacterium]|nr:DUF1499 domain-containing protein [Synechococcaceae cyanobacterium]
MSAAVAGAAAPGARGSASPWWRQLRLPAAARAVLLAGLLVLLLCLSPAAASASLLHLEGAPPQDLGLHDGNLSACASPSHCACDDWPVADPGAALQRLRQRLTAMPGAVLRDSTDTYLYATVSSRLFGFVDDLELYADSAAGRIQAISRSRLGDSDLGVNARRLESLHLTLAQAPAP